MTSTVNLNTRFINQHSPIINDLSSFDKFYSSEKDTLPLLLKSKEDSAPAFIFNTYWLNK